MKEHSKGTFPEPRERKREEGLNAKGGKTWDTVVAGEIEKDQKHEEKSPISSEECQSQGICVWARVHVCGCACVCGHTCVSQGKANGAIRA